MTDINADDPGNTADGTSTADGTGDDELDRLPSENEALRTRLSRRAAVRRWLTVVLVVLTSLSVVAATVAVWAHERVFDTDAFMDTVEPALDDPAFYSAISTQVSTQTLEALDIETRVTEALTQLDAFISQALLDALEVGDQGRAVLDRFDRPSLAVLAPSIASGLETRVTAIVDRFVTSEEFTTRLPELVRRVHQGSIALIRNELTEIPNVSIVDGEVNLNLLPIIAEVLSEVGEQIRGFGPDITLPAVLSDRADEAREQLAAALQTRVPDDFGQVTIMSEARLGEVQEAANRIDRLVWLLVILAVALAGATIAVSLTRRRTLLQLAIGVAAGLVISVAIVRRLEDAIVDQITNPDGDQAARAVLGEVVSSLRSTAIIVGVAAVVVGVAAYLAGRPAWLTSLSERMSQTDSTEPGGDSALWVTAHYDLLRTVGFAAAVLVLFITGIELIPLLVIAIVLAAYLWALAEVRRRTTPAEIPVGDDAALVAGAGEPTHP